MPHSSSATNSPVSAFLRQNYRHFNAAALVDAADGYARHIDGGGKMLITLAGAASVDRPLAKALMAAANTAIAASK